MTDQAGQDHHDQRKPGEIPSPLIGKPAPAFSLGSLEDPARKVGTADFSGHYGSPEISGSTLDTKIYNFMFGPQLAFRSERASVFGRALFGGSKAKADNPIIGNVVDDTSFAWGVGGGIDFGISPNFAIRPAQFDYIWSKVKPTGLPDPDQAQNNFRYSAGVVLRF